MRTPATRRRLALAGLAWTAVALVGCGAHDGGGSTGSAGPLPSASVQGPTASGYVRLARGVPAAARPERDRGPLATTKRIANLSVVFKLSAEQVADREALKAAQLDPASPHYHQWLTPEQYAARFGARPSDIERTKDWLASQGLEVHDTSRLGSRVTFAGTVDHLQSAFRAPMRQYEVAGETHYAMAAPPQVPVELGPVVLDVVNTHDFYPRPMSRKAPPSPDYQSGNVSGFAPPDWAAVYDVAKAYSPGIGGQPITGAGVTIAVVGIAKVAQGDVDTWRTKFGLPSSTVTMTLVPGTGAAVGDNGSGFEATLDVEWSGGIGQGATVNYVYVGGDDPNVDDATLYAIENDLGSVLSTSWGSCDGVYLAAPPDGAGLEASDQNVVDVYGSAANLMGITYVASSGDWGATSCLDDTLGGAGGLYVDTPSAYPSVTSVGGTQFATGSFTTGTDGYFTGYSTQERAWNEQHAGTGAHPEVSATGGGISVLFSRPSYQLGLTTCSPLGSLPIGGLTAANMRQVPDVSFTAAGVSSANLPLLVVCTFDSASEDCTGAAGTPTLHGGAGTSFSAPAFAGVVALMDQVSGGRLGNVNPLLYALSAGSSGAFHDITAGTNEVTCNASDPGCGSGGLYGYVSTTGYDCTTGLGSLDVYNLLGAMSSLAPTTTALAATPTSTTEGTPVGLTATVALASGSSSAQSLAGGKVTFAFQSYDQNGKVDLSAGSWTLGTSSLAGSASSATATLSIAIPPGLVRPGAQSVDVYATYGGDAAHFPSTSAKVTIQFAALTLAVAPVDPHVDVNGNLQFSASGGSGSFKWYVATDTTCNGTTSVLCSGVDETSGAFTAGGAAGTTEVIAMDSDGAYASTIVYVGIEPDAGGPLDAGMGVPMTGSSDAGSRDAGARVDAGEQDAGGADGAASSATPDAAGSGEDSGTPPGDDAGSEPGDAATSTSGGKSGCGCREAGAPAGNGGAVGLAGMFLFGFALRRRRVQAGVPAVSP